MQLLRDADNCLRSEHDGKIFPSPELRKFQWIQRSVSAPEVLLPAQYKRAACSLPYSAERKNVISPGMMSPSRVPCVTSSGSALAMIIWYFISQNDSLEDAVFPQWNPINVSFCVYGNLPSISSLYMSFGTVLLISRRVTASSLTTVPINSLSAP